MIQLRIQIRQTFEASCRPDGVSPVSSPVGRTAKKPGPSLRWTRPPSGGFIGVVVCRFLGGNEDEPGFRSSCFVVFFSIGLLVGGEGRGSLGVKVENPNV